MSNGITHEQYIMPFRNRVAAVTRGMLSGDINFLEGAIELVSLRHKAEVEEADPDFMVLLSSNQRRTISLSANPESFGLKRH